MTDLISWLGLALAGLVAGLIDSIAGGGGLITLPTLSLALGPGAHAIGTNKIVGVTGAGVALLVYLRHGHFEWRRSIVFSLWAAAGAVCGSRLSPFIPPAWFRVMLAATCPVILWIVWRKDLWVAREPGLVERTGAGALLDPAVLGSGFLVGLYDGAWGPGGGTFMFLALLFVARLPLLGALAAAKFTNTFTAGSALVSYTLSGYVHWREGLTMAAGIGVGAYFGATHANRSASRTVRPVLVIVVALLVTKLLLER